MGHFKSHILEFTSQNSLFTILFYENPQSMHAYYQSWLQIKILRNLHQQYQFFAWWMENNTWWWLDNCSHLFHMKLNNTGWNHLGHFQHIKNQNVMGYAEYKLIDMLVITHALAQW